jgi:pimeloyl-ACP methyl ester carboxylesterase
MTPMESGLAEVDGGKLAWESAGEGPGVAFLHPGLWDFRVWDEQFGVFSKTYRVLRHDLRGYGRSSRPEPGKPYSHVDDLEGVMDAAGIDQAALVGNSMGGRVAIDFALEHPSRVSALVLAAPGLSRVRGDAGGGIEVGGGVRRRRARDRGGGPRRGPRARRGASAAMAVGAAGDGRFRGSSDPADRVRQSPRAHDGRER